MGCWGMGMTQSDQFMETYETFMDEYNEGAAVPNITKKILEQYLKDFSADDPILHDVWFGLAKAEWMCCEQSEEVLTRVREIIESGANLDFYRESGANNQDLKTRKRNLDAFWRTISTPRAKPRKRTPEPKTKQLPPLEPGDVMTYPVEGGRRVLIVLDRPQVTAYYQPLFCCILKRTFARDEIKTLNVMTEPIGWFGLYDAPEFLPPSSLKPIGHIEAPAKVYASLFDKWHGWNGLVLISGRRKDFTADYSEATSYNLNNLMHDKIRLDRPLLRVIGISGCGSREEILRFTKYVNEVWGQ